MIFIITAVIVFTICMVILLKDRIETYAPEIVYLDGNEEEEVIVVNQQPEGSRYYYKPKKVYDSKIKIRKPQGLL
jgi:hypothetical protein